MVNVIHDAEHEREPDRDRLEVRPSLRLADYRTWIGRLGATTTRRSAPTHRGGNGSTQPPSTQVALPAGPATSRDEPDESTKALFVFVLKLVPAAKVCFELFDVFLGETFGQGLLERD